MLTLAAMSSTTNLNQRMVEDRSSRQIASFLSSEEQAVVAELNMLRSDPRRYAKEVVEPFKLRFVVKENEKVYINVDSIRILTKEGVRVVDECIRELVKTKPMSSLIPYRGLSLAALEHTREQGKAGSTGHEGIGGSTPWNRIERYGEWGVACGENIDYGNRDARSIIISLLVDDGVPTRGHRKSLLNPQFGAVGVSIGIHPKYRWMCTITLSGTYKDR